MPNHVRNVLKFKKLTTEDIDFIKDMICDTIDTGAVTTYHIDFDKIIPEPKEESECPDDCKVNKDSHIEEYKDREWFDWYKWHNKYWGTKWNAYDSYTMVNKSSITFVFNTAWNMPSPVIRKTKIIRLPIRI